MREQGVSLESLSVERCPECGASFLMHDQKSAEVVCTSCGFVVLANLVDRGPEWRAFTSEQQTKRARAGAPHTFTIHDKGFSTKMDWRDFRGFPPEKKAQLHRLLKWQRRSRISNSTERNLITALSEMHRIAYALNLPKNILETASLIYRKGIKKNLIRGRSILGMTVAALYLACRQCRVLRTVEEICEASGITKRDLMCNYRHLVQKLNYFVPHVKPGQYVTRLCNKLEIHGEVEEVAHKILKTSEKLRLSSGKGAKGIAAAASYIASRVVGQYRTQREFAEAANITEVTIRNRYKDIVRNLLIVVSL